MKKSTDAIMGRMFQQNLKTHIVDILVGMGISDPVFSIDIPTHTHLGDYSTSVALAYAKKLGKKPVDVATEIKQKLEELNIPYVVRIDIVAPGFINFFLNAHYFAESISDAVSNPEYGKNKNLAQQKIMVEYTVTNVLKPMHIGHLMGNIIGESLSRIIENSGAEVKRNNYQGDSGLHIAKAVWGIMKLGGKKEGTNSEKAQYIGLVYVTGAHAYEDDENAQREIKEVNKNIFEKIDPLLLDLYQWGRRVSLDHFEELYKKLGTTFDYYFFESEVTKSALFIVQEFLKKGLFEESDGAIVFHGEKFDSKLHTRVFINSQGIPMYEAKDIAHALRKYETYPFDISIIVTANEQNEYFKVVLRALQEINQDVALKIKHVSHGLLKLPSGKMGSRKGNVITAETLIFDVEDLIQKKIAEKDFTEDQKKEISELVAIGAIKYSILRQAIGGDIIFDFEKSLSFEGDSGPYLQYATVRANSLLKKAEVSRMSPDTILPKGWQTTNLERLLVQFPFVVERAAVEYAPHHIVTYLVELASEFNSFYAGHKIIDVDDATSSYRLALTKAFVHVMTSGLYLLGIKVPPEM